MVIQNYGNANNMVPQAMVFARNMFPIYCGV